MAKGSDKLLIAISAVASHGKTKTGKQLVRTLFHDKAFRELCPGFKVKKMGRTGKWATEYTGIEGTGDWVAYFSMKKDANPLVTIITGGDDLSPEVRKEIDDAFDFPSVKIAVNACRPNNDVHRYLLEKAKEYLFQMVETSTFYVANHYCGDKKEEEAFYDEWCGKRADELKEIIKGRCGLTDFLKLCELHQQMKQEKEKGQLAFLFGNGINQYATGGKCPSWKVLLQTLWRMLPSDLKYQEADNGLSLLEQFDLLENNKQKEVDTKVTELIKELIGKHYKGEEPYYKDLRGWLEHLSVPVLTTNFDGILEKGLKEHKTPIAAATSQDTLLSKIYRWNEYSAISPVAPEDMGRSFSVWHIHGYGNRQDTIRLDSSTYMGQATYTRNFLQDKAHLWAVLKDGEPWGMPNKGMKEGEAPKVDGYAFTWLNIFYNSAVCINGLGLSTDETYLRWLLISRFKYQKRIGIKPKGWYVYGWRDTVTEGMKAFLRGVGIEPVYIDSDDARYRDLFDF